MRSTTILAALSTATFLLAGCGATPVGPAGTPAKRATAAASASAFTIKAEGTRFSSTGDPHEVSGDGCAYDNQLAGIFVKLKATTANDLELHVRQALWAPGVRVNTAAAVKANAAGTAVKYFPRVHLLGITTGGVTSAVDAKALLQNQTIALAGGGSLAGTLINGLPVFTVKTSKGDVINLRALGATANPATGRTTYAYVNIDGALGNRLAGEVRGELGTFDQDGNPNNDLRARDGAFIVKCGTDPTAFERSWLSSAADAAMLPAEGDAL